MKLYFYFLETLRNGETFVRVEECEAIEKSKTYYPLERFPIGFYGSYVRKSDIGRLVGLNKNIVILVGECKNTALDLFESELRKKYKWLESEQNKIKVALDAIKNFG